MLGVPLMIMGAAKQAVAKKIDKRARGDLKEAMGNVAGAMGGGTGVPAFARTKSSNGSDKKQLGAFRTRILAQQERKKRKEKFSDTEQMPQGPSKPLSKIKSDLNVSEIDLSTNTTGGENNSPNALEIGLKKAKEKREAEESDGITRPRRVFYKMKGFPRQLVGDQKNLPEFLQKEILDAPPLERYNSETMEMESLKPVNRSALQMIGRKGDNIPIGRMHSHSSFPKKSAAGKAKLMKTKYGQTGKAILDKNLIQPVYKKIYKDK